MRPLFVVAATAAFAVMAIGGTANAQQTLKAVKEKGFVTCGVGTGTSPGFAYLDDSGKWTGVDVDVCRALAAAIFGDSTKVKFVPTTAKERFTALQSGEVDLLSRTTTWTFTRDVNLGFDFQGVNYYDGQGFMVRKDLGVKSARELDGATVCVTTGTTTELNLTDYFRANNMKLNPVVFERGEETKNAYISGRCDAYTTDSSGLASIRATLANPDEHMILPELISKEPLGPVTRHGDNQWGDIVRWTLNTLIVAEELGVTQANVDDMRANSTNPEIRRMLGVEGNFGPMFGLSKDWAYNIIKQVGNYGESFERLIGVNTALGLPRGLNQLWNKGGILYAPPFR